MPSTETLERFVARVEQNAHADAIEEFCTVDASMQENQAVPRSGRDNLVNGERIAEETFFYDPAQRLPKTANA